MGTESEISVQYSSMSNSRKIDCTIKTGEFIGKVNLLMQEFYFAESKVKIKLINIFATSFCGFALGIFHPQLVIDCISYGMLLSVFVLMFLQQPINTSLNLCQVWLMLKSCYVVDWSSLKEHLCTSNKSVVSLLTLLSTGDRRTTLGRNMAGIKRDIGGLQPSFYNIRKHMKLFGTPVEEQWRIPFLE